MLRLYGFMINPYGRPLREDYGPWPWVGTDPCVCPVLASKGGLYEMMVGIATLRRWHLRSQRVKYGNWAQREMETRGCG
jgi:hypothetical protein